MIETERTPGRAFGQGDGATEQSWACGAASITANRPYHKRAPYLRLLSGTKRAMAMFQQPSRRVSQFEVSVIVKIGFDTFEP